VKAGARGKVVVLLGHDEAHDISDRRHYVPVNGAPPLIKRAQTGSPRAFLDKGLQTPILVRADGARFVLVKGLHRLEAAKALGDKTIAGFLIEARKH
jgi:sulfiredoxin